MKRKLVRHKVLVELDLEMEDQTDPDVMVECITTWIGKAVEKDRREFEVDWPTAWRVKHQGHEIVETDAPLGRTADGEIQQEEDGGDSGEETGDEGSER